MIDRYNQNTKFKFSVYKHKELEFYEQWTKYKENFH